MLIYLFLVVPDVAKRYLAVKLTYNVLGDVMWSDELVMFAMVPALCRLIITAAVLGATLLAMAAKNGETIEHDHEYAVW